MNACMGTLNYGNRSFTHMKNPDSNTNTNGRNLLNWIEQRKDMVVLNGLTNQHKNFDSKFTYYRGNVCSQNEIMLSNNISDIHGHKPYMRTDKKVEDIVYTTKPYM